MLLCSIYRAETLHLVSVVAFAWVLQLPLPCLCRKRCSNGLHSLSCLSFYLDVTPGCCILLQPGLKLILEVDTVPRSVCSQVQPSPPSAVAALPAHLPGLCAQPAQPKGQQPAGLSSGQAGHHAVHIPGEAPVHPGLPCVAYGVVGFHE